MNTLVLNTRFYAIHIADCKNAISLVYQGHAEVVDENYQCYDWPAWTEKSASMPGPDDGFLNTTSLKVAIPAVIRLTRYDKLPSASVKFTLPNLLDHFDRTCSYCGHQFPESNLNRDHVMPRSRQGPTNWDNIVISCEPCNKKKANRTPEEAGMKLLVKPVRPKWRGPSYMIRKMTKGVHPVWHNFLEKTPDNSRRMPS